MEGNVNLYNQQTATLEEEVIELLSSQGNVRIERILSMGQASPEGFWYDQEEMEWVCVLEGQGVLQWEDGSKRVLERGDWIMIPPHVRHRVLSTSVTPPCIWLAFFWKYEK
ncbi:MAG TPA: cupin domain-containing protein [Aminobacterium sp.]|jgi:cupin 2 domain-containing protein|uniref:cupin domain-containing protein n=1 Tax=Aminobacterium TaxID=81466 RepID=UPI000467E169|nr:MULTISPECIES: cupin domain-containing protein [Aminobacterium]HCA40237.1 cupin domain-containing protein [Aminobacterium sp.]